jgi:hypothetical protein
MGELRRFIMLPMWPSENTASKLYDLANGALIVGLVIGVISTCLIVRMGGKKDAYLKKALSETNERAANAEQRAAEANKAAEDERLARIKLEGQVVGRRLSGAQKAKLTAILKSDPDPVGIVIVPAFWDGESSDFADDFNAAIADAKWKTFRIKNRATERIGVSLGIVEGTPELDPWHRSIAGLRQEVAKALDAIGVPYHDVIFGKSELASTSPPFEPGPIYLVIEHKASG